MYEELIEELRRPHADCNPWALMEQAADAIDELDTLLDGVSADNDALCETIERMKTPRWIPVTERLPDGEALAINALKGTCGFHEYLIGYIGENHESDSGFLCENDSEILMNVTHWMPLPTPPKEET